MTHPTDIEVLHELKRLRAFEINEHPRVTVERIVRYYLRREYLLGLQIERLLKLCDTEN